MSHLKRDWPSFQTYASDELADESWLIATFAQRGYFATLQRWCWINGDITANPDEQARLLGRTTQEVIDAQQSMLISRHFKINDRGRMYCVELKRQREVMRLRRERMAKGGSVGGKKAQQMRGNSKPSSSLPQAPDMKRREMNGEEVLQGVESIPEDNRQWVEDYDR